jgi:cell division protein FtsW (lipid II flippase)
MSVSEATRVGGRPVTMNAETVAVVLPVLATALGVAGLLFLSDREMEGWEHHLLMIIGMTLAMMSPFAIPLCRAVARATLWWHADVAVVVALLVFVTVWTLTGGVLHLAVGALSLIITPTVTIVVLALCCAAIQIGRRRARLLNACQFTRPLRPGRHVRVPAQWAGLAAARCVRVCALPMALTAVQPGLAGFAVVAALLWVERIAHRPQLRVWLAIGYLGLGAALVATQSTTELMPATGHHSGHH